MDISEATRAAAIAGHLSVIANKKRRPEAPLLKT
jgi:hypothetical protein